MEDGTMEVSFPMDVQKTKVKNPDSIEEIIMSIEAKGASCIYFSDVNLYNSVYMLAVRVPAKATAVPFATRDP